jgi:hypothetical protein
MKTKGQEDKRKIVDEFSVYQDSGVVVNLKIALLRLSEYPQSADGALNDDLERSNAKGALRIEDFSTKVQENDMDDLDQADLDRLADDGNPIPDDEGGVE